MTKLSHDEILESLEKKHTCYVLITCDGPAVDGSMQVEMHYGGDPALAEFLIQGAQTYFEENEEEQTLIC